jgi:exopolysaccharide biosynthesis polyprenyl glycosylphosphotransferase
VAVLTIALLGLARLIRRLINAQFRKRGLGVERVLIVGAGELGRAVMRTVVARPELGYHIVGFVDDNPAKGDLGRFKALGNLDDIETILKTERVDEMLITLPWMYHRAIMRLVRAGQGHGVRARVVPDFFQLSLNRLDFSDLDGIPLIGIKEASLPRVEQLVKRLLDLALGVVGLALAGLPMLIIALLIRLESPGPALFKQVRVGAKGKLFGIYKFRSMRVGAEAEKEQLKALNEATGPLFKIKNDPRLTRTGKFLRRISFDELPNLFNVLRGEMSLVGPRPGLPDEVAQYEAWHRQRLEVKPGMTGLWQVSGRSDLPFDEMCLLDIYYIENWSLALDFTILLRTLPRVLLREGAY